MINEKIWIGNIVRVGSNTPRYMYSESKNFVEFRTMKDKIELGWLDKNKNILYLNDDYKDKFKAIKKQIEKDYNPVKIGNYINMRGLCF